jgi:gamma-glutamylputrescine oxidase
VPTNSLWAATAIPAPNYPALNADARADVAIIGGGFTGLSAAIHIAKDGRRPVVLEANEVGFGASGRNGGLASGKFRVSFQDIAKRHGSEAARRMYELGREAVDCVEELIEELGIEGADFRRCGYVTAAHTESALKGQQAAINWLRSEVRDTTSRMLSREEVVTELGTTQYVGGSLNTKAAALHPLNYVRGLARAASAAGIAIHENSPVLRVRQDDGGSIVETPRGSVRARQVIYATNGYSDLTGATRILKPRVIPFRSAIIATVPLPEGLRHSVLPTGRVAADTKRLLRWYRMVGDRLIFGGRGAFGKVDSPAAFKSLQANMTTVFPQLAGHSIEFRWSGLVAMTLDYLPHIGQIDDRSFYAMGYNGTGVALTSLMGRYLAAVTRGETPDLGLLGSLPFRPVPFYPVRAPAVRLVTGWYQILDALGR